MAGGDRDDLVYRVARQIAAKRREQNLTQEAFAALLGIATKNVQRIEAGKQNLSLATLERIAKALGTTPAALVAASAPVRTPKIPRVLARLERAGFRVRTPLERGRKPRGTVPVMTLRAAAGQPAGAARVAEVLGWVVLPRMTEAPEGQFVAEVEGRSMDPRIPSGSICLFGAAGPPPYRGRIVLVSHGALLDDVGAPFAVKRIKSIRHLRDGRTRVVLESLNPDMRPITIETHEDDQLRVVADLVRVLVRGG